MTIGNASVFIESVEINPQYPPLDIAAGIAVPIIVSIVGYIISYHVHKFHKKSFEVTANAEKEKVLLAGLVEAFRLLNDVKHREARKVLYNIKPGWAPSESSFNIIGIKEVTSKGESNQKALEDICKDIVKNDCNEIGVLAHYGLVDTDKFVEEGFWVILKVWGLLKDEIMERRKRDSLHHMKHLQTLRMKACEYAKKNDPKVFQEFCPDTAPTTAAIENTSNASIKPDVKTAETT